MTLIDAILKAKPHEERKYTSPPPEVKSDETIKLKRIHKNRLADREILAPALLDTSRDPRGGLSLGQRIRIAIHRGNDASLLDSLPVDSDADEFLNDIIGPQKFQYAHVQARVDSSPPQYNPQRQLRKLEDWAKKLEILFMENVQLLTRIRLAHFMRGRVDCRWRKKPFRSMQYCKQRVEFLKRARKENLALYKRILGTNARVETTAELNQDWIRNKRKIVEQASTTFVLFPPIPQEQMEDQAFKAAPGVKRPRVYIKLGMHEGAVMGEICVELFMDTCPNTCRLFLELLDGDAHGYGYVNTCFFRKVPHLYWSGGDVIYNNGFGCYAQSGREVPIGAENYHYPHSMPGLLSMRVTVDDEMCGIFNITFKPLPQLDLRNVVFGRVVRPSSTYDIISKLGVALSSRPVVEIRSSRRKVGRGWRCGKHNTKLAERSFARLTRMLAE